MELLAQASDATQGTPLLLLLLPTVVAVAFGAWSASAAARKGIPRWVGWLLGIFLLLLGRIIVGLLRDRNLAVRTAGE